MGYWFHWHHSQQYSYIHTFGKGSSQLCAHFSVCAVYLYCYRGSFILCALSRNNLPPSAVSPHSAMSSQGVGISLQQTGPSASCTPQQFPYSGLTQQRFTATGAQQRFTATGAQSEISQQAQCGDGDSSGETSVAVKKQKMDPQYMTERKLGSEVEYHCMHAALFSAWVTDSTVIVAWSY